MQPRVAIERISVLASRRVSLSAWLAASAETRAGDIMSLLIRPKDDQAAACIQQGVNVVFSAARPAQYFTLANSRTLAPGISTTSLV